MKLNVNSWHSKLYKFSYDKEATKERNFCDYFWKTVLAIILFPMTIYGWIFDKVYFKNKDSYLETGFFVSLISVAVFATSFAVMIKLKDILNLSTWFYPSIILMSLFIIVFAFSVCKFIGYLIEKSVERDMNRKYKPKKPNFFVEGFKNWKNKTCSIIEWEKNK